MEGKGVEPSVCCLQVNAGDDGNGMVHPLIALAGSRLEDHLLLAGTTARVRLFDLRTAGRAVAELQPHDSSNMVTNPQHRAKILSLCASDAPVSARLHWTALSVTPLVECE